MKINLEKQLEDVIFDNRDTIHERGFIQFLGKSFRQYALPSGKKIDLLTYDKIGDEIFLNIIEIKKDDISGRNGVVQAYEYASEMVESLFSLNLANSIYLKVVLVGYDLNDLPIMKFMTFLPDIYIYKIDTLDGIKFTQETEGGIVLHKNQIIDELLDSVLR